jgi:hypothetical protein
MNRPNPPTMISGRSHQMFEAIAFENQRTASVTVGRVRAALRLLKRFDICGTM